MTTAPTATGSPVATMAATDLACDDCAQPAAMLFLAGVALGVAPILIVGARVIWRAALHDRCEQAH